MNTDNLTQELDRLMMEEGYIEVSDKNDMIASLLGEHNADMKLYRKILGYLYSSYSYFENGDETFFYNPYDTFESIDEFKKEFNIK